MKFYLTVLSLAPICLLTIIMNFRFVERTSNGEALECVQFILSNLLVIILLLACALWCVVSFFGYIYFKFMFSFGANGGYTIKEISEEKDVGLNFFLTLILPLLVGDLNEWQNMVSFVLVFITIFVLLIKTDLFYANSILTILGYHIYKVTFNDNPKMQGQCIVVAPEKIECSSIIEYKVITAPVLFAKAVTLGGKKSAAK